ncbi:MAG TPA: protein kinase [Thermoanaerobaculia bacterium]|nr:protein kinase [Thermoanaerobaculia bacterium]
MPLAPGTRLGPFEVLEPLGSGSMGDVYRAKDTRLGRDVALKVLSPHLLSDREGLLRFAQEARAASALNHPSIVTIYEIGQAAGMPYLAMEFITGKTVREIISDGPLPVRRLVDLAAQLTDGLARAHGVRIVHRDLKPENLMVSADGFLKILDFGIAKLSDSSPAKSETPFLTEVGMTIGTPSYMSPEQASGRPVDFRSDQFSAGLILYELATGKRAFHRANTPETLTAIIREDPEPLTALAPRLPAPVRWIIERCLSKDPDERYASTRDLARDLKQMQLNTDGLFGTESLSASSSSATSSTAAVEGEPAGKPASLGRHVGRIVAATLGILALITAGAGFGYWLRREVSDAPAPSWTGSLVMGGSTRVLAPRGSPDGRRIAFLTVVGGLAQVAVMDPFSGDWTVLTKRRDAGGSVHRVEWSADGSRLFFDRVTDVPLGVFSIPSLGGDERLVLDGVQGPVPLPDGSLLVVKLDEEHRFVLVRFWPDTGKQKSVGPPVLPDSPDLLARLLPDGKDILVWGRFAGEKDAGGKRTHLLNLETGAVTAFLPGVSLAPPFLPLRDNRHVLARVQAGDLHRIVSVQRDGAAVQTLLTVASRPRYLVEGESGALYVGFAESAGDVLRFPTAGGVPERLAAMPAGLAMTPVEFPDGRLLVPGVVAGRRQLLVTGPEGELRPLLGSSEAAFPPVAVSPSGIVAFLTGASGAPPQLGIASIADGRLLKRHALPKGTVPAALAASRDGKTFFFADAGTISSLDGSSGTTKALCAGHGVAGDPTADEIVVQRNAASGVQLVRVALASGVETPILTTGPLKLAPAVFAQGAIGPDRRILVAAISQDTWAPVPALLDPGTGSITVVPVSYDGEIVATAWGRSGLVLGMGLGSRGEFWAFRPRETAGP